METVMIGARIEKSLDERFRALCKKQGISLNDALKRMIKARIENIDPEAAKSAVKEGFASAKTNLIDCTNRILELRHKIRELDKEDDSFFGDGAIGEAKQAIHREIKRLTGIMNSMTSNKDKQKSESQEDDGDVFP